MAYTRVWDNAAPPGSALANTLDTIIQEFRQDTQQRISSLLASGTDIDTDPLQLKPGSMGPVVGAAKISNPFAQNDDGVGSNAVGLDGVDGRAHLSALGNGFVAGTFDVAGMITNLPFGAAVTGVTVYGVRSTGSGTTNVRVYTFNVFTGVYTLITTLGALPGAYGALASGVLAIAAFAGEIVVRINGASAGAATLVEAEIGGVVVNYNIAANVWIP